MPYGRKMYRRRPRKYLRRGKRVGSKGVSTRIKKYVKRAIHRTVENKTIITYASNQSCASWTSGTAGASVGLLPNMAQGTGENQRIGNQIRITSGIIRGQVNLLPYNATTNPNPAPVWVKMFLYKQLYNDAASATAPVADGNNFFRGNGTVLPFQSNVLDLDLPINDSLYRLCATKTFKIGAASYSTSGPVSSGGYFDNSPMCKKFSINWGKFCRKNIKFNDGTSYPQNESIYLIVQPVAADGSTTAPYIPCEWHYVSTLKFEDA